MTVLNREVIFRRVPMEGGGTHVAPRRSGSRRLPDSLITGSISSEETAGGASHPLTLSKKVLLVSCHPDCSALFQCSEATYRSILASHLFTYKNWPCFPEKLSLCSASLSQEPSPVHLRFTPPAQRAYPRRAGSAVATASAGGANPRCRRLWAVLSGAATEFTTNPTAEDSGGRW
jgi:hypothetical protein